MSPPIRKMVTGVSLFVAICLVAVGGYLASGWQLDDAIYMVIITIFGVGYQEVQPVSSVAERALTIAVIIAGYGAVIYTAGGFMQLLIDGELQRALGARRMSREIEQLRGHTIICGLGRMGTILARELKGARKTFLVIDSDTIRVRVAEESGYLVIHGDAAEEQTLEAAGIRHAAVLATVLSDDAANVFVTITAREMNPELQIIARGENPRTEKKLCGCGASHVVLPTAIGARKLAQMIIRPSAENMLAELAGRSDLNDELQRIGLQFGELRIVPDSPLVDHSLSQIALRGNHGFLIVGVRNVSGQTTMSPPTSTILKAGDVVIVLGRADEIPQLAEKFACPSPKITYRGATI